uniref:drebrin-like protein n=1 Tax=Myxine glutinosa TaxID=7769 RepID=UPI00358EC05F
MAVNLSKNRTARLAAYEDVCNPKTSTDWALFSYEGNSNDLKLVNSGAGGLNEMVEELNSGKIMYAYCRVKDPNAGLSKYVLVNWYAEDVNDIQKGKCANHLTAIACFFKGAHVTINARTEDDVEPDLILQKVAKASGVTYSIPQENLTCVDDSPQKPVGSVYQKTNAAVEIKKINKGSFWAETEEEKRRKEEEMHKI